MLGSFVPLFLVCVAKLSWLPTVHYTVVALFVLVLVHLYADVDLPAGVLLPAMLILSG